ncbi:short-chain dehydrogenase [Pedobacter psychrophilus]|uniref:Short-chain dehydrogenase n=1 Tax=Pedobacter psychrophilus TaxID=1826909 RepID=A0A179DE21_9SPHI|nr:SDR family oxidoreductase [Pedobacter psychrophilus]OAQ39218.1 short-chain dehydrogenase [Pedobacter psychrophilus]
MQNLKDKVALITGASKGIGYGIAEALLKLGVKVAITSRSQESADEAAKKLGSDVLALASDVKSAKSQQEAVDKTIEKFGSLDFLIANAGVGHFAPIDEMEGEDWHNVIDTNLTGVFLSVKSALPALKKSKGYIITISSLAGTNFFAGGSAYNASKFGLTGFSQSIMLDLREHGIKVTTIMPGSVATHFNDHEPDKNKDAWKIQPEDIGQMVCDLLNMNPRTLPSKIEVRPTKTSN